MSPDPETLRAAVAQATDRELDSLLARYLFRARAYTYRFPDGKESRVAFADRAKAAETLRFVRRRHSPEGIAVVITRREWDDERDLEWAFYGWPPSSSDRGMGAVKRALANLTDARGHGFSTDVEWKGAGRTYAHSAEALVRRGFDEQGHATADTEPRAVAVAAVHALHAAGLLPETALSLLTTPAGERT